MIKRFIASPLSGYIAIVAIAGLVGVGIWFWYELKEFGGLEQRAESQARDIKSLENEVIYMQGKADKRNEIGLRLSEVEQKIDRRYEAMRLDFEEALKDAPKEYIDCRNMLVPERLRYPAGQNRVQND